MQATPQGPNRTGTALNPKELDLMLDAVQDLSPPVPINTVRMDVERQRYITEAESVGSVPPPKSGAKRTATRAKGAAGEASMTRLFDKLGERIAFERTGTRLYSALITKYLALMNAGEPTLPEMEVMLDSGDGEAGDGDAGDGEAEKGESALQILTRIRAEELGHFRMLCEIVVELGGDPTAQTPCADVTAAASMGLMQVLTDPRTTLAQCLNTILTAELTDNAGWELLSELAEVAGQKQLLQPFEEALATEQEHLAIIQGWLKALMTQTPATHAV